MKIDFEYQVSKLTSDLNVADSYLSCEAIILQNIKKHLINEVAVPVIESYLKKLLVYFEDRMVLDKDNNESVNYRYASCFLKTIIATPYWHSWSTIIN